LPEVVTAADDGVVVVHADRDGLGRAGDRDRAEGAARELDKGVDGPAAGGVLAHHVCGVVDAEGYSMIAAAGSALAADGHDR
jgi:hypothetical protein